MVPFSSLEKKKKAQIFISSLQPLTGVSLCCLIISCMWTEKDAQWTQ